MYEKSFFFLVGGWGLWLLIFEQHPHLKFWVPEDFQAWWCSG